MRAQRDGSLCLKSALKFTGQGPGLSDLNLSCFEQVFGADNLGGVPSYYFSGFSYVKQEKIIASVSQFLSSSSVPPAVQHLLR